MVPFPAIPNPNLFSKLPWFVFETYFVIGEIM